MSHRQRRAAPHSRLAIEREVLRWLCQSGPVAGDPRHQKQLHGLAEYRFLDATHQIIFETLCELRAVSAPGLADWHQTLREHLARRLVRKGFPDVDLEPFLRPASITKGEIQKLARRLTDPRKKVLKSDEP